MGASSTVFDHSSFETSLDSSQAEVIGAAAFDDHGKMIGAPKQGHFGARHGDKAAKWAIDLRIYPAHFEPFVVRVHSDPRGALPTAGQQTLVIKERNRSCTFDLQAIYKRNAAAAQSVPEVADALAAAGPDGSRLVVLLPGVPRLPEPTWTPLPSAASGAATADAPGSVTATVVTCPNCGAPLEITSDGKCGYCEVPISLHLT
jgi:hypothetical protein